MKKVLLFCSLLFAGVLSYGQTFTQQAQLYVATTVATVQPTVPQANVFSTHTLTWITTGTVVGTAQIQACTTTLTSSCANMTGSVSVNLASSGSYTLEGQTAAFGAFTITISTCTTCTVNVLYVASNPALSVGNLQDGVWYSSPDNCTLALTTGAFAANPANSGGQSAPALVREAAGVAYMQVTTSAAASALTVDCPLMIPSRLTTGKGVTITGYNFFYGNQTSALTSITTPVVNLVTWPAPPSLTPLGTVTQPATATLNPVSPTLTTTTLGQCNAFNATLSTPVILNSGNTYLETTIVLNQTVAAATVYQVCGIEILYQNNPL